MLLDRIYRMQPEVALSSRLMITTFEQIVQLILDVH